MTPNALGLDTANKSQGLDVIPAGTQVELVMKIRAGSVGLENLFKRSSKGDAEGLDLEFTVRFTLSNCSTVRPPAMRRRPRSRARCCARSSKRPTRLTRTTTQRRRSHAAQMRRLPDSMAPPSSPPWRSSTGASARTGPATTATRILSGRSCASATRATASSTNRRRCRSSAPRHLHSRMPQRQAVVVRPRSRRPLSLSRVGPSDAQDAQDWPSDSGRNR